MDVRDEIRRYLEDPDTLYREWYLEHKLRVAGITFGEKPGEETGTPHEWKNKWREWVNTHAVKLRTVICPNAAKIELAATQIDKALEVMRLIEYEPYVSIVKQTATLLVVYGIEKLCEGYET